MKPMPLTTMLVPLVGLVCALLLASNEAEGQGRKKRPAAETKLSAHELSGLIDRRISARWQKENVQSGKQCDDGTFFRRVHLDLVGKIPVILDIRDFLDDDRPDKRQIWVDKILASESHADHFANVYRQMMISNVENQQTVFLIGGFESWLRKKLKDGAGYDKLVQELLLGGSARPQQPYFDGKNNADPTAFFAANENKPENLAGATAKLFLGVKIECAQCHKHPFAAWTRTQFWEFAAFFNADDPASPIPVVATLASDASDAFAESKKAAPPYMAPQIRVPKSDELVTARFLDGSGPKWQEGMVPNKVLADWITSPKNPYFAKVTVNQVWHYFFGTGLVDPVDDFGTHNPASHPELLDELADQFVKNGYDLKYLMRAIVNSKAYQLASAPLPGQNKTDDEPENLHLFARMPLRPLSGEQLFDSIAEIMEYKIDRNRQSIPGLAQSPREEFVAKFSNPENKRVDTHTSILQALQLMNGRFISDATSLHKNKALNTIATSNAPTDRKIETLYLVALGRLPTAAEADRFTRFVDSGGPTHDSKQALADVFWVLLNSVEFSINH